MGAWVRRPNSNENNIGGRGERGFGAPSVVRKFVGKGGGCPDVGVRGSGVEGGLRPVPRGRPAKKKIKKTKPPPPRYLFNLGEKGKMVEKGLLLNLFVYP